MTLPAVLLLLDAFRDPDGRLDVQSGAEKPSIAFLADGRSVVAMALGSTPSVKQPEQECTSAGCRWNGLRRPRRSSPGLLSGRRILAAEWGPQSSTPRHGRIPGGRYRVWLCSPMSPLCVTGDYWFHHPSGVASAVPVESCSRRGPCIYLRSGRIARPGSRGVAFLARTARACTRRWRSGIALLVSARGAPNSRMGVQLRDGSRAIWEHLDPVSYPVAGGLDAMVDQGRHAEAVPLFEQAVELTGEGFTRSPWSWQEL